jgi:hypothetical protein
VSGMEESLAVPPQKQTTWMLVLEVVLAVVLPIAGLVIAIALFATHHLREGIFVFVGTLVGVAVGFAFYL